MQPDWKHQEGAPLGVYFSFLAKKYVGAMLDQLSHVELDRYFVVLSVIEQSGESFSQQNLADYFQIDKASMVRMVDYLVQKDYIIRQVNNQDRREYFLILTDKGRALVPEIKQSIQQLNETALKDFSPAQSEQFFLSLDLIRKNLSGMLGSEVSFNLQKVAKPSSPMKKNK